MPLSPTAFAIVHATVLTISGPQLPDTPVVVDGGKIVQVGGALPPEVRTIVDGTGKFLMPGLIDMHSHMGVYAWPGGTGTNDGNEAVEPFTPRVWSKDSFDPEDPALARARAGGITTIQVLPGSANMIGGQGGGDGGAARRRQTDHPGWSHLPALLHRREPRPASVGATATTRGGGRRR